MTEPSEVTDVLDQIRQLADSHREEFGFLPYGAYAEQAAQGHLWVIRHRDASQIAGYVLFGGRRPQLRIFQLFVSPSYRGEGIGATILVALRDYGREHGYYALTAKVVAELPANRFWASSGFALVSQDHPESRRTVNWYFQDINAPSLFQTTSPSAEASFRSLNPAQPRLANAVFVLDLNVVFDLVHDRIDSQAATRLISGALANRYRVVVTTEFVEELDRHKNVGDDPILSFANGLPTLPALSESLLESLSQTLIQLGLPNPKATVGTRQNVRSDLRHLASCIHHKVSGFVTRDGKLLKRADRIREKFGIEVVSPTDLDLEAPPPLHARSAFTDQESQVEPLNIRQMREDERDSVTTFLSRIGVKDTWINTALDSGSSASPRVRVVAELNGRMIGFSSWHLRHELTLDIHLFVDEQARHPQTHPLLPTSLCWLSLLSGE